MDPEGGQPDPTPIYDLKEQLADDLGSGSTGSVDGSVKDIIKKKSLEVSDDDYKRLAREVIKRRIHRLARKLLEQ